MKNEQIIEVLESWNFWNKNIDTGIIRENYLKRLLDLAATKQIVAITGIRRSGKSTLMKQFIKKLIEQGEDKRSFLYINFEEPKFSDLLSLDFLQKIYEAYIEILKPNSTPYILLDEVHRVPKWEKFVRGLHEKKEAQIIVSGSTSQLLSKEIGSLLTGRWVNLNVNPLNLLEFLNFNNIKIKDKADILLQKVRIKQLLRDYLEFGGFPLVALRQEKGEILQRYFEDILTRDIVERYKIRKTDKLKALTKYYLTNFSSLATFRHIAKFIGLSLDSVERFSFLLSETYLIYFVPKFSYSLKEQEINPRKVYCIDPGLINIISFRFTDNIGRLYENITFVSLLERKSEIYYYKDKYECDFILKKGKKIIQAIQVSYKIKENREREIGGLLEAMKKFKLKKGLIITDDLEGEEEIGKKKVIYIPLWKWLLNKNK